MADRGTSRAIDRLESRLLGSRAEQVVSALEDRRPRWADGLTIVIPSWNHRAYLPRAIRSALAAADRLREGGSSADVLVIDDASRDGSARLLRSLELYYADPRLATVLLSENFGLPRVRNLGLRLARHRHVILLDADNQVEPVNVPAFLSAARATGATVVHGNLIDRRDGRAVGMRSGEVASLRLTETNYIDALAVVDAPRLLELGGYAESSELYGVEDWELILHLVAEEAEIVFVPLVLGYYHVLPMSMLRETGTWNEAGLALVRRVYAQASTREWDTRRVGRIFHPELGWLDDSW